MTSPKISLLKRIQNLEDLVEMDAPPRDVYLEIAAILRMYTKYTFSDEEALGTVLGMPLGDPTESLPLAALEGL